MADDGEDLETVESRLEAPSLFRRRRSKKVAEVDAEPAPPPAVAAPEVEPPPEPVPAPTRQRGSDAPADPEPDAQPERAPDPARAEGAEVPGAATTSAVARRTGAKKAVAKTAPAVSPRSRSAAAPTPEPVAEPLSHPDTEPSSVPISEPISPPVAAPVAAPVAIGDLEPTPPRGPWLTGMLAVVVTGLVVGIVVVVLTAAGGHLCTLLRGTSSCGGPGLFLLVAILLVAVVLGAFMLRTAHLPEPTSTAVLGVGLLSVLILLFLVGSIFSWWMIVAIPVLSMAAFSFSHWVTTAVVPTDDDVVAQVPSEQDASDVR